jgi:hypothetical protein
MAEFIVYEGNFLNRFVAREIVGQTDQFWKVRNISRLDETRLKKQSVGPCAFVDSAETAKKLANQYTDKMIKADKHFRERKAKVLGELASQSTRT